jgi:molybdate transport system substrate-binding protein
MGGAPRVGAEELTVLAAASLTEAFQDLTRSFEAGNPDAQVTLAFAGSQQLALQIAEGAPADIFASADLRWMDRVRDQQLLAGSPSVFARNRLIVIVPIDNPAGVETLPDLARPGLELVVADPAVPLGAYTRSALEQLARAEGFDSVFLERVLANVVSLEQSVKEVVGKVVLGEADAGVVYRSDATAALANRIRVLEIPEACSPIAAYPIAILQGSKRRALAQAFVDSVLSPGGQATLERHGFLHR